MQATVCPGIGQEREIPGKRSSCWSACSTLCRSAAAESSLVESSSREKEEERVLATFRPSSLSLSLFFASRGSLYTLSLSPTKASPGKLAADLGKDSLSSLSLSPSALPGHEERERLVRDPLMYKLLIWTHEQRSHKPLSYYCSWISGCGCGRTD